MTDSEQKMVFSKNLNRYLSDSNKTQKEVADAINVSPQTFNTWCQGIALPRMGKVQLLADYFGIAKSNLIDENPVHVDDSHGIQIPVLGRVAAGIPITATEYIIDTEEISEEMAADGEYFALQIKGDSMEPKISDGDVVIVRRQNDADDGDLVIALVNGDDAVCKRLKRYADSIALLSSNPAYEPMYFSGTDVDQKPVTIIGKVKELRAKF